MGLATGCQAGFALAPVNLKGVLEIAQLAIRLPVIAEGGTARLDRLGQNLPDDRHQCRRIADGPRLAVRGDSGAV